MRDGPERRATYLVDQYNGEGAGVGVYSLKDDGIRAGARPGGILPRRGDEVCKGRGGKQNSSKERETAHVDARAGGCVVGKEREERGARGVTSPWAQTYLTTSGLRGRKQWKQEQSLQIYLPATVFMPKSDSEYSTGITWIPWDKRESSTQSQGSPLVALYFHYSTFSYQTYLDDDRCHASQRSEANNGVALPTASVPIRAKTA